MKPLKRNALPEEENTFNEKIQAAKAKATRHLVLIRHGQYNLSGANDVQRFLTDIGIDHNFSMLAHYIKITMYLLCAGKQQAEFTGERLRLLEVPWDKMIKSTMTRAQETGKIIATKIESIPVVEHCSLIEEGAPIAPEPPIGHWRPEPAVRKSAWSKTNPNNHAIIHILLRCLWLLQQFFQDGARIEAGFRKHFHRAEPSQEKDSYTLIVCHANVIRYFVCR